LLRVDLETSTMHAPHIRTTHAEHRSDRDEASVPPELLRPHGPMAIPGLDARTKAAFTRSVDGAQRAVLALRLRVERDAPLDAHPLRDPVDALHRRRPLQLDQD